MEIIKSLSNPKFNTDSTKLLDFDVIRREEGTFAKREKCRER